MNHPSDPRGWGTYGGRSTRAGKDSIKDCKTGPEHGSFGEFLSELRSLFPPALLDGAGWERLLTQAHRLPIHVADNRFGFEFDLCDPDPAADFCVVPQPGSRLAEFYVRQGDLAAPGTAEAALGRFLADQARDPDAPLAEAGGIILEYDLAGTAQRQPALPGVFVVTQDTRDESRTRRLFGDPETLAAALWAVAGWSPDEAILRQMQRIYRLMPPIAGVSQAGILPGRPQRAIRLIMGAAPGEGAVEMLARLGWSGSLADVAAVCESLAGLTRQAVSLSVDVTARGISPRLGLEFHRPAAWHELDHSGWNRLIDRLQERGWCLPDKAIGLKALPRVEHVFDQTRVYLVRQNINHVKVVFYRGTVIAKAYAGTIVL